MKVQTKSGFVCDVDINKAKDWRFVKALAMFDDNATVINGMAVAVPFLLGEKGEKALMEHVKTKEGNYPADVMLREFREIMDNVGSEAKKSQSSQE